MKELKLTGKTLEEVERIVGNSAIKISESWYEIVLKNYVLGLFQRKLYIMCNSNGVVQDYYYRVDIR